MTWNDNKRPLEFERYRRVPMLFGSKYGWFFHTDSEHANLTTRTLERLLKEQKAYLVIDKDEWEKQVQKYRGAPAEDPRLAKLKAEKTARLRQLERLAGELKERQARAQKMAPKDAKEAAKMLLEIDGLRKAGAKQQGELAAIQRQIDALAKK